MKQIIVDNQVTNYYIDEDGKCFNQKTNKYLKGQLSNSGYWNYNLSITPNNKKRLYAHRLVAQYYINNEQPIPAFLQVNHIDGNKLNNNYKNLELVTPKENMAHCEKLNLKQYKIVYQFDKELNLINTYKNIDDCINKTNLDRNTIVQELYNNKKKLTYNLYY